MSEGTRGMGPVARLLLVGLLVTIASACTTVLPPERTEALGPPFNEALKNGYVQLADSRWQAGSWDVLHFRDKATRAMLGNPVWPDEVGARLPSGMRAELAARRDRLIAVLDEGGWAVAPKDAALAQVSFDCWLAETKANRNLDSDCRDIFMASLRDTEQAVLATLPAHYAVLFESGSDTVDAVGLNVATAASRAARLREPRRIRVTGYADPSGAARANEVLSLQRAENVAAALARAGVPRDRIEVEARGATEDGRRVEIALEG